MTEDNKKPVTMKDVKAKAEEMKCSAQQVLIFIEEFLAEPMCGRCFPCSFGSYEARIRAGRLVDGTATDEDIDRLKRIGSNMAEASMCKKGKDTAAFIMEKIENADLLMHLSNECIVKECKSMDVYLIDPGKCTMCGACLDACRDFAIKGEKASKFGAGYLPFEIAQKRCTKCGECLKVCADGAVLLLSAKEIRDKETVKN